MRLRLDKRLRIILIVVLILGIGGIGYLIYEDVYNPGFEDKLVPLFNYDSSGAINYTVYLRPNNLYTGSTLGEGELYITEFVDHIKANLKFNYKGKKDADIRANYSVIVRVEGYAEERDKEIDIWKKDFPIIENKNLSIKGDELSINEMLDLYLDEYDIFATEIIEASKIRSQARLTLLLDVNLYGVTSNGDFSENISPNIVIPLGINMFRISGESSIDTPGSIDDVKQVKLPINMRKIIFHGTIAASLILALIFLIIFVIPVKAKDPLERKLKKIFKKHGDRLVALNTDIEYKKANDVRTFEDLVRVADEMDKPILYRYSKEYRDINRFYVIGGNEAYILNMTESQSPSGKGILIGSYKN